MGRGSGWFGIAWRLAYHDCCLSYLLRCIENDKLPSYEDEALFIRECIESRLPKMAELIQYKHLKVTR